MKNKIKLIDIFKYVIKEAEHFVILKASVPTKSLSVK